MALHPRFRSAHPRAGTGLRPSSASSSASPVSAVALHAAFLLSRLSNNSHAPARSPHLAFRKREGRLSRSNVSLFEQTIKCRPDRVRAVPLWMLQVPRPDARPVHDAREFCVIFPHREFDAAVRIGCSGPVFDGPDDWQVSDGLTATVRNMVTRWNRYLPCNGRGWAGLQAVCAPYCRLSSVRQQFALFLIDVRSRVNS